jgi:hypothetical protein
MAKKKMRIPPHYKETTLNCWVVMPPPPPPTRSVCDVSQRRKMYAHVIPKYTKRNSVLGLLKTRKQRENTSTSDVPAITEKKKNSVE